MSNTNKSSTQLLTTKEEIYAAHQALVNVIGGQFAKELDMLVNLSHTALAAIPAGPASDNKPLTAEEIKKSWSDWNFEWKGERNPTTFDAYKAGADFAVQQTAAKEARIAELEEKLKADEGMKWQTAEQAIFSEMEGFWNEAQQRAWLPKLLKIIDQQTANKDARIKELEENYRQLLEDRDDYKEQAAALREELAATEKMIVKYKSDLDRSTAERLRQAQLLQSYKDRSDDVEAVKKERDRALGTIETLKEEAHSDSMDLKAAKAHLEEAVKLLQDERSVMEGRSFEEWNIDRLSFLDRLSSGETKPASPWIKVEDRLPEPYKEVYAGSFDEDGDFGQTVCWHTGEHWEGNEITEDSMITHWTHTLPAPPESLTDK